MHTGGRIYTLNIKHYPMSEACSARLENIAFLPIARRLNQSLDSYPAIKHNKFKT
jgi:hypothetical protein